MLATKESWAIGYAKQALSDLGVREVLVNSGAEKCHRLYFLQMAAEKACKAHLFYGGSEVGKSHAVVGKHLPTLARVIYARSNNDNEMATWEVNAIKRLAKEIELLAPACHPGNREDNSEYPWLDSKGEVCTPCEYNFPNINDRDRQIVRLLKLIRTACESYSQ